ncbi:WXG100 family type VII secretion target [Streptomyces radiopugnans]|nr:WXG100 family type VII secretion target [Streptomyces radiopugnans]
MTDKDRQDGQDRPEEPFVAGQLVMTDLKRNGALIPVDLFGGVAARNSVMGTTDFEKKDLEEMFSLVDDADPADIENAADTLWDAGGKIRQIGDDLKKHIDKVDWEGEFGDSFREWGRKLSRNTLLLADFTEKASTQLKAAGVGLSMVRSGMPERDPAVMAAPRLESIPPEERVESNEKYKLAKKKEDDRQEAINQMNRLASYYKVSHDNMKGLEEPEFGPMPNVGMPPAPPRYRRKPVPGGWGRLRVSWPRRWGDREWLAGRWRGDGAFRSGRARLRRGGARPPGACAHGPEHRCSRDASRTRRHRSTHLARPDEWRARHVRSRPARSCPHPPLPEEEGISSRWEPPGSRPRTLQVRGPASPARDVRAARPPFRRRTTRTPVRSRVPPLQPEGRPPRRHRPWGGAAAASSAGLRSRAKGHLTARASRAEP